MSQALPERYFFKNLRLHLLTLHRTLSNLLLYGVYLYIMFNRLLDTYK